MRWRILFTKIPGSVLYEINSSHKTFPGALREVGGHELGEESVSGTTGWERRRGSRHGDVKRESQTHRNTHREKHTQRECVWESQYCGLLAGGCVLRNFRMFHCVMCYLYLCTTLSRKPNIKI